MPVRRTKSTPHGEPALSPPNATERQSPPTELTVAGGPWRRVSANPIFRRLVPTMMASIAGGTRVGRVCSVAFGVIARRVGRVTRIAMVGCASGRTRTIERDTKGAKTRFIASAYGKFESSSLQQTVPLSLDSSFLYRKAGSCRGVHGAGQAARPAETRWARQHHANCR